LGVESGIGGSDPGQNTKLTNGNFGSRNAFYK